MANRQWSSTALPAEFKPYIAAEETVAEFSLRAVILGSLFGILFGAVSVYVGLRAGLTVSASIPIAVLSISILRAFGRSTILENNIVQTTGSAGESVAAGGVFLIPALIFFGFLLNTEYLRIFFFAVSGGCDFFDPCADIFGIFAEHRILANIFLGVDGRMARSAVHDSAATAADRE